MSLKAGVSSRHGPTFRAVVSWTLTVLLCAVHRCGHCKNLKPAWTELAREMKGHKGIKIGAVDCTSNAATCQVGNHQLLSAC
jgi:hypothetical protein